MTTQSMRRIERLRKSVASTEDKLRELKRELLAAEGSLAVENANGSRSISEIERKTGVSRRVAKAAYRQATFGDDPRIEVTCFTCNSEFEIRESQVVREGKEYRVRCEKCDKFYAVGRRRRNALWMSRIGVDGKHRRKWAP